MKLKVIMGAMLISAVSGPMAADMLEVDLKSGTRVRDDNGEQRVQQSVTLKVRAKLGGGWEVVGVARTGGAYDTAYESLYDTRKDDRFENLDNILGNISLRNLYISKKFTAGKSEVQLQAGALERDKGLAGYTALAGEGWVDGVRVKAKTKIGSITFTAGSINDLKETGVYDRDVDVNYYELKMKREVFDKLVVEVGGEIFEDEFFAKFASSYEVSLATDRAFELITEILYNIDTEAMKSSVGVKGDLINLITGNESKFTFEVRHSYMSEDMGDRGTAMTGGFGTFQKSYGTASVSRPITKNKKVKWYLRFRHNYEDDYRLESGLKVDLY